jgi:hypothetical protein
MGVIGRQGWEAGRATVESPISNLEVAIMWTRRLLLATMVAAAAMSIPRHLPADGTQSAQTVAANAYR